jgi:hypothetical protein
VRPPLGPILRLLVVGINPQAPARLVAVVGLTASGLNAHDKPADFARLYADARRYAEALRMS